MNEEQLKDRIAYLESYNDQLQAELLHIDEMMRLIGFVNGLETIKETAEDITEQGDYEDELEQEFE